MAAMAQAPPAPVRNAFVLGSTSEVARAICRELARRGCRQFHLVARNTARNQPLAAELQDRFGDDGQARAGVAAKYGARVRQLAGQFRLLWKEEGREFASRYGAAEAAVIGFLEEWRGTLAVAGAALGKVRGGMMPAASRGSGLPESAEEAAEGSASKADPCSLPSIEGSAFRT